MSRNRSRNRQKIRRKKKKKSQSVNNTPPRVEPEARNGTHATPVTEPAAAQVESQPQEQGDKSKPAFLSRLGLIGAFFAAATPIFFIGSYIGNLDRSLNELNDLRKSYDILLNTVAANQN